MGAGENIVNSALVAALQTLTPTRDPFLKDLEAYAAEHRVPILQPESAQLLELLTAMKRPKHVLEIGTAIGYSAVRMALAMGEGKITTIEKSPEMIETAKTTFENAKTQVVFEQLEGDAAEVLKAFKPSHLYDLVFIDAAKSHYKTYFDLVTPLLASGALVISDNVLFRGLIAEDQPTDKRFKTIAKNLKAYLAYLMAHEDFITSLVPIGDGFALSLLRR